MPQGVTYDSASISCHHHPPQPGLTFSSSSHQSHFRSRSRKLTPVPVRVVVHHIRPSLHLLIENYLNFRVSFPDLGLGLGLGAYLDKYLIKLCRHLLQLVMLDLMGMGDLPYSSGKARGSRLDI
jgi:hypothetical protein